jgi:hypothetical protein
VDAVDDDARQECGGQQPLAPDLTPYLPDARGRQQRVGTEQEQRNDSCFGQHLQWHAVRLLY